MPITPITYEKSNVNYNEKTTTAEQPNEKLRAAMTV